MTFEDDVRRFTEKVIVRNHEVFLRVCEEVTRSVVEGSEITGAPGQPVGQYGPGYHPGQVGGTLKASWISSFPDENSFELTTNLVYAPVIEEGVGKHGPITLRSTVGGFHSVKLTRAGLAAIVEYANRQVPE